MKVPNIIFSVNNEFISYLIVAIRTLGYNNKYPININLIYTDLSKKNINRITSICKKNNYHLFIHKIDRTLFNNAPEMGHLKIETYYRLIIPKIIEEKYALYLDCDIYINSNIRELFEMDIKDYALAAVPDPSYQPIKKLNMNPSSIYFNAGILILNLDYWRENNISEKVLNYAINNIEKISYADQCAINAVIDGNFFPLSKKYNFQSGHINLNNKNLLEELNSSKIIHFTGSHKPTHYLSTHPFKNEYLLEFKKTPHYLKFQFKNLVRISLKKLNMETFPSKIKNLLKNKKI
jgi:lipopolysaccharide biosynthesis glycosyltransferase